MRTHPGRTVLIYEVAELVKQAFMSAMTPTNITSGFRATGIYPYNRDIFPDEDYAPSMVTDRPNPEEPSTSAAADPSGPSHEEPTHYIYIYAFSRRFYPKRLTITFRLYIFISMCVPWESNPQPFALLTQCSTTEPPMPQVLKQVQTQGSHLSSGTKSTALIK